MIEIKKNNQNLILIAILSIIVILALVFITMSFLGDEEPIPEIKVSEKIPTTPLLTKTYEELKRDGWIDQINLTDDSISPLVSQGLILQMNRIRHRGLLEEILKKGLSWRQPPMFYYIATIDGKEYISKDIHGPPVASSEYLFNSWDTIMEEVRIQKDITQEQETSSITIQIVERMESGLLGLRTQEVVQEEFHLTYCYRTGLWTGDNYFDHPDGYGRYRGETFEVQFRVYQTDFDQDGIPYWTEANILGTDPRVDDSYLDPDADGVPTAWEWKWGYDPFAWDDHSTLDPDIDGITNVQEYKMSKYYADPFSQDIYLEVDNMEGKNRLFWDNILFEESAQIIIERYAQHGINFYIDDGWPGTPVNAGGELLPFVETVDQDTGLMLQFYNHHFPDERKGIFRYMIVGHNGGFAIPSTYGKYDTIVIDSSPYKVYLKRMAFTPRTQRVVLAAAALHEIGHTLGITPWTIEGCDNFSFSNGRDAKQAYIDTWGNYESVMNYFHIWDKTLVDYSDGSNGAPYDQNDWEYFYLPFFKIESNVIEDPFLELPGFDRMVDLDVKPGSDNKSKWMYQENLTTILLSTWNSLVHTENVLYDVLVYACTDDLDSVKNVRVYAKPDVDPTYALWSLVAEGSYDKESGTLIVLDNVLTIDAMN